jgi:hypothetical protein
MKRILVACLLVGCGSDADKGIDNMPDQRGRRSEALVQLDAVAKRAKAVFRETKAFPIGTSAELPARNGDILGGGCCGGKSTGAQTDNKCAVSTEWAGDPVWKALAFTLDKPSMYRFKYASTDGKSFVLTATGDLDCDEKEAVFTVRGKLDGANPTATVEMPAKGEY